MNSLANIREKAGYKQIEIAKIFKLSQSTVSMWESGSSSPRIEMLPKLAAILNVTEGEIITAIMAAKNKNVIDELPQHTEAIT